MKALFQFSRTFRLKHPIIMTENKENSNGEESQTPMETVAVDLESVTLELTAFYLRATEDLKG